MIFLFLICILFTVPQFSTVNVGKFTSAFSQDEKHPALGIIINTSSGAIGLPQDDINYEKSNYMRNNTKIVYFCPPQYDWQMTFITKLGRPCLFPVKWTDKFETVECQRAIVANITRDNTSNCGKNNQGIWHSVYHTIFTGGLDESAKFPEDDETLIKMEQWETYQMVETMQVYNVCFNHKTRQTYFVLYDVTSYKLEPQKNSSKYTAWDEDLANFFGLESVTQRYQKEYQSRLFHWVKNKWNSQDYLEEQMLIPSIDLREDQAGRSIMTYLTVAPQWKSLRDDWKKLNKLIKENIVNEKSNTTELDFHKNDITIVCGTYGEMRDINTKNIPANKSELPKEVFSESHTINHEDQQTTSKQFEETAEPTTYPLFWWKLVKLNTKTGIFLIMPNYPKNISLPETLEILCKDDCNLLPSWRKVKDISERIMCCKWTKELLAKLTSTTYQTLTMIFHDVNQRYIIDMDEEDV